MCQDCGCTIVGDVHIHAYPVLSSEHLSGDEQVDHDHSHDHPHPHDHGNDTPIRTLTLSQRILSKNDRLAERNRGYFLAKNLLVLNLLSSPGSGKTSLIERTSVDLCDRISLGVIVGDLATDHDAQRLRQSGASAVQITTGTVCHLEAEMVAQAAQKLNLDDLDILIIENVGNLVCPAAYDLGEELRVAILSVTEGEDKPLKYPALFKSADIILINKIDLAEAVDFNREKALDFINKVAPQSKILEISARTGEGMTQWYDYLHRHCRKHHPSLMT